MNQRERGTHPVFVIPFILFSWGEKREYLFRRSRTIDTPIWGFYICFGTEPFPILGSNSAIRPYVIQSLYVFRWLISGRGFEIDLSLSSIRMENRNGNCNYHNYTAYDNQGNRDTDGESLPISSPPSVLKSDAAIGYIEHPVSKLDTLAGIAIKYGVEVCLFHYTLNIYLLDCYWM